MIDLENWDEYVNDRYLSEYLTPDDYEMRTETLAQIEENHRVATARRQYKSDYALLAKQRDAALEYAAEHSIANDDMIYWSFAESSLDAFYKIFTRSLASHIVGIQPVSVLKNLMYKETLVEGLEFANGRKTLSLVLSDQTPETMYWEIQSAYSSTLLTLSIAEAMQTRTDHLTTKFTGNLNEYVIKDLIRLAFKNDVEEVEANPEDPSQIKLICRINANCSDIARMTRRGVGNFIIVNKSMLPYFDKDPTIVSIRWDTEDFEDPIASWHGGAIDLFMNNYVPEDMILVGYKGQNNECDTGYILKPNKINLSTNSGNNGDWRLGVFSLDCEKAIVTPAEDEFNKASDYYRVIKVIPTNG